MWNINGKLDKSIISKLNLRKSVTVLVTEENIAILRKYSLKYLGIKGHDVYNFHSGDSDKNYECVNAHTRTERTCTCK